MEFLKMLALSTAHLTQETRELMERLEGTSDNYDAGLPVYYGKGEYGWFVYAANKKLAPADCPTDLEACIHLAHHRECQWIMFDYDVDPIEELPVFEP